MGLHYDKARFGRHVSLKDTLYNTIVDSRNDVRCKVYQFFLAPRTSFGCRTLSSIDKERVKDLCKKEDLSLYVHSPYVLNLAAKDPSSAQSCLKAHLNAASGLPISVVLHIGNGKQGGDLNSVLDALDKVDIQGNSEWSMTPHRLLFENSAGQGNDLGKSVDELRHIFEALGGDSYRSKQSVGLCIDTCHAYASGMYDLSTVEDVDRMFEEINPLVAKIDLIHLNDSVVNFGKKVDRHASLGKGAIFSKSNESLKHLLQRCVEDQIDVVLETPAISHQEDLDLMFSLI